MVNGEGQESDVYTVHSFEWQKYLLTIYRCIFIKQTSLILGILTTLEHQIQTKHPCVHFWASANFQEMVQLQDCDLCYCIIRNMMSICIIEFHFYHNPEVRCSISFLVFALILGSIVKIDMYLWKPFSFHTTLYAFHHPSTSTATMTTVWFEWSLWYQFSAQKFDALQLLVKRVGDFWWLLWLPTSSDYHGLVLHSLEVILTHVIVSVDGLGCEKRIK